MGKKIRKQIGINRSNGQTLFNSLRVRPKNRGSDLKAFGFSNEAQSSRIEIEAEERKAKRAKRKALEDSHKRGNHYRSKFKRSKARLNAFLDGKEIQFPYSFEFSSRYGTFRIEESEKLYDSKKAAIQNCQSRLNAWWKKGKRAGMPLPKSLIIKGRKIESDNGIHIFQLYVSDNSTARQFSDGPLLPPKIPDIGERKPTHKENGEGARRFWKGDAITVK